ncbi:MAG TPA: class I SAM-dependent methyltransferase [Gaiellaceae bacterium]
MTRLDDQAAVREQYAREDNLRARQALYEETSGPDAREVLRRTLAEWGPQAVLEVGGGPGELSERMRVGELGARVSYLDSSPRMVELARARGVDARVGDVQELPFEDGEFDTVVAAWMLYHVPDLARAFAEIARVLRPGGALIAVTNSVTHLGELRALVGYPAGLEEGFNRENGAELLRPYFPTVAQHDLEITVTVRDRSKLVAYQQSMSVPTRPVPDDVEIPFVLHRRPTVFFATT